MNVHVTECGSKSVVLEFASHYHHHHMCLLISRQNAAWCRV